MLHQVKISGAPAPRPGVFKMGSSVSPRGERLGLNQGHLLRGGKPWFPVMGEIHFSRVPQAEWRRELRKMKEGGVDIAASYVFWIHHEEREGFFDWSGCRDLRRFVRACRAEGMLSVVRIGPWAHGECRQGGFPDWLEAKGWKLRSDDPRYMAKAAAYIGEIGRQLKGLMWKDGGPVVGIQIENEFHGPAEHLLALKALARKAGLDTPYYTYTGWTPPTTPLPYGELLPLFGVYAEGFWERELSAMPQDYWSGYRFSATRIVSDMGAARRARKEEAASYPFLTCEVGAGMISSYHRRLAIKPLDVLSTVMIRLGSGSNLMGYYMYHGGENPEGKLSSLEESQRSGGYSDLTVKNYDFQTAIGQYGQLRPQYFTLRRLHLFLKSWGHELALMPPSLPLKAPKGKNDLATLRWSARSDGKSGFIFINNHQRLAKLPPKKGASFEVELPGETLRFPRRPVTVPAEACFFWPFNMDLAPGLRLKWATAQALLSLDAAGSRRVYFAETPGVKAEFALEEVGKQRLLRGKASRKPLLRRRQGRHTLQLFLLSEADSLALNAQGKFEKPRKAPRPLKLRLEKIRGAEPARKPGFGSAQPQAALSPSDADFSRAASWRLKLPKGFRPGPDSLLRVQYQGDVARLTLDGRLLNDDFSNGDPFELGLKRHAPGILKGELRLEIMPRHPGAPVYYGCGLKPRQKGLKLISVVLL
jgi:beta-galactosidase